MKRLLTAAAALSLLAGGAALAQATPATPDSGMGQSTGAMTPPPASGAMAPAPADAPPAAPAQDPSMAAPAAGAMAPGATASTGAAPGAMDTSAAQSADTPSAAPGTYPKCTHKGQDRCTTSAAAASGKHKKTM